MALLRSSIRRKLGEGAGVPLSIALAIPVAVAVLNTSRVARNSCVSIFLEPSSPYCPLYMRDSIVAMIAGSIAMSLVASSCGKP